MASSVARGGAFAQADRRLARSVVFGLVLLGIVALLGPLISYRSDSREIHAIFRARIARETSLYAHALELHLGTLEAELVRLAQRPEIDLRDNTLAPERELLEFTHHNSALFTGVALVSVDGTPLWSEPKGALPQTSQAKAPWFQRLLATHAPIISGLPEARRLVIAVPILRQGLVTGAVLGLIDPTVQLLPGGQPVREHMEVLLLDAEGGVVLPEPPPAWATEPGLAQRTHALVGSGGAMLGLGKRGRYADAQVLGSTGLTLILTADEEAVLAPMRGRVLWQLFTIAVLQLGTFALFTLYLRSTYRRYLQMEERATEREQLAALGGAASLIAHEVKNSVNGLRAAVSLLESGADPQLPARTMRGQLDRLGHLARSLLQFGKPNAAQRVPLRLEEVVRQAIDGLRELPEMEDVLVEEHSEGALQLDGDPLLLVTALDNLVRNAIEAAAAAKDLGKIERPRVWVRTWREQGAARVDVEDNAGGPPGEVEQRMFQPFVTSKPKGIGLGLLMARRAVEEQGGTLRFERTAQGSRFTVRLPLQEVA